MEQINESFLSVLLGVHRSIPFHSSAYWFVVWFVICRLILMEDLILSGTSHNILFISYIYICIFSIYVENMNRKLLLLDLWVLTNHLPLIRFIEFSFMQPEQIYFINSKSMTNEPLDMPVVCTPTKIQLQLSEWV